MFTLFKYVHVVSGFLSLFIFWIPMVTPKGGKSHIRIGWIYVVSMALVALSAVYMGTWRIVADPEKTTMSVAFAWFLIFIAVLSSSSAWYGIRVLRLKRRSTVHRHPIDLGVPLLLILSGAAMSLYGYQVQFPLLTWFPLIGLFLGISQLYYWLRIPKYRLQWWFEHMSGMFTCCIATLTAFAVFGTPRLLEMDDVPLIIWFLPTILMLPILISMIAYYQRKFKTEKQSKYDQSL